MPGHRVIPVMTYWLLLIKPGWAVARPVHAWTFADLHRWNLIVMGKQAAPRLLIVGVHQATEAYPNTLYRVRHLKKHFDTQEINEPLWTTPEGGLASARSPLRTLGRALAAHVRIAWRVATSPCREIAYVPYPAIGVVLVLALLPRRWRPSRIALDGFISIYDTVVNDRRLWTSDAIQSRVLWAFERLAFRMADVVVVDTLQNAHFYARVFRLSPERFVPVPLAINEPAYAPRPYRSNEGSNRVLFIGTFVPLHGVEAIAGAIQLLAERKDVKFRLLGDGQDAIKLQSALEGLTNVVWQRRWHSAKELAEEIAASDVCLGVFGAMDKTQRVCPYKLYSYAAVGRATITGDTEWLRSLAADGGGEPFWPVRLNDAHALAEAIEYLVDNPSERARLARNASIFYERFLANTRSLAMLDSLLVSACAKDE